jgi:uncharacterized protein (AIM24 family)
MSRGCWTVDADILEYAATGRSTILGSPQVSGNVSPLYLSHDVSILSNNNEYVACSVVVEPSCDGR